MRRVLRLVWSLPRLVVWLIWQVIWAGIKVGLVILLLSLGLLYVGSSSQAEFESKLVQVLEQTRSFLAGQSPSLRASSVVGEAILQTDHHESLAVHWPKNAAKVYLETDQPTFRAAYEEAMANWEATGLFSFVRVTDKKQAEMILTDYADSQSLAAGLTKTEADLMTEELVQVTVYLNRHYLLNDAYNYTYERIVHTAEHELGHAMGLEHDDSQPSVMQSAGSYYGIQEVDVAKLARIYKP